MPRRTPPFDFLRGFLRGAARLIAAAVLLAAAGGGAGAVMP